MRAVAVFDREAMRESVPEFLGIYAGRPLVDNPGGMGLNHSWATWYLLSRLQPSVVVESGIFRGHSTWLIEQAVPNAQIYSFDIDLSLRSYVSQRAHYAQMDFTQFDWSEVDTAGAVCFFDDHQNAYQRLVAMSWFGFRRGIFEDNWPVGEGDNYSLKHVFAGSGAPSVQMSRAYAGNWWARRTRRRTERRIASLGTRQNLLVKPNAVDLRNLQQRLGSYREMPAVRLAPTTMWHTDWSGEYAVIDVLAPDDDFGDVDLSYSYLAYVELGS